MSARRKGGQYYADFMIAGARHRAFGFESRRECEAWELQARAAIKLGKPLPSGPRGKSVGGGDAGKMSNVLRSAITLHWSKNRGSEKSIACVKGCVKKGAAPVFVTADGKVVKIANPDKVTEHLGHKVKVTGKLEGESLTIDTVAMAH